jgi:hypothetical protein
MSSRSARRRKSRNNNRNYFAGGRRHKCDAWRTPRFKGSSFAGMDEIEPGLYMARQSYSILPLPRLPEKQGFWATFFRALWD